MARSSTRAVYNDSNVPHSSKQSGSDTDTNTRASVPLNVADNPAYSLDRFLGNGQQASADQQEQRPPPGLGPPNGANTRSDHEIEAEARARMTGQLRAFDAQFGLSGNRPTS
ncbi:hypothetical protein TARUN_2264 [Trichoderma arundinaceum]|uniref:Uncharacterized protein n=1 Tax=Trichoderma arundinaceum TaxID=490622 RepID=A0A395NUY8_TRIAR|nr:hypothetical protein TARUN_2264 [Trichoderma arundinaceum]